MKHQKNYAAAWTQWERNHAKRLHRCVDLPVIRTIARHLAKTHLQNVVEIGFGNGRLLKKLAQSLGPQVRFAGFETNFVFLNTARKKLRSRLNVELFPAAKWNSSTQNVAAVYSTLVLQLLPRNELSLYLQRCRWMLDPGGIFVAIIPHPKRMAQECKKKLTSRRSIRANTSWDGAAETTFLRTESYYRQLLQNLGFHPKFKTIAMPGDPNGYCLIVCEF